MTDIPVGIDLGTTYSCVAVYRGNGAPEIIPNLTGKRTTPSYVAYVDDKRLVGDKAKSQATVNPKNTIFDVKRLIGRQFKDRTVQEDINIWPFQVVEVNGGFPRIKVTFKGEEKLLNPIEISAAVLSHLKTAAENHLGSNVFRAVVAVPSYFNDNQREDTKNAATLAGLEVMRIINEPTAAALAYGLHHQADEEQRILIFDLGGGTFDVTIMMIEDGVFTVQSTSGDTHLGGEDFTGRLVAHCVENAKTTLGINVSQDKRALGRIRVACEAAKLQLAEEDQQDIEVQNLLDGKDFLLTVHVDIFEKMTEDLFARLAPPLERALEDANMTKADVTKVVLVGGASRMRRVRLWLHEFFDGLEPVQGVNADEAVACGAALQAFKLGGNVEGGLQSVLTDVLPLSLGVDDIAGDMYVVIKRNTQIPVEAKLEFTTFYDNQGTIVFDLFEGERPLPTENNLLGSFCISGLTLGPRGKVTVIVTITVDSDGLCVVTGEECVEDHDDNDKGTPTVVRINNTSRNSLTRADIDKMIIEARIYEEDDRKDQKRLRMKTTLENLCLKLKSDLRFHTGAPLESDEKDKVDNICTEAMEWLLQNQASDEEEIQIYTTEVKNKLKEIFDA